MAVLETYLNTLASLRNATVPETSYYAALQTLLNEVGAGLRPRVQAVIHPKNTGAGIVDLGLFDENQPNDQKPARGIIEAKPVSDELMQIAQGEQVARYVAHYGQALVTNYYQFVLVTRDAQTGLPVIEERYDIAAHANAFWEAVRQPRTLAQQHETALREYLMRVMRRNAPLSTPQDVAWILASYAREARARIEVGGTDLTALDTIREQLEAALGVRFQDETAEEFFRSTLVQTLFYGLFSAWVLWHEKHPGSGKFDLWRDTRRINIPIISELFEQFSSGTVLPLSVEQILEWTTDALNRVERTAFFATFNKGAAVQYFYEPFLEAFDPELRRQLGVWYTPPEVVEYMVARVDLALKTELGIPDGLADPSVYVLDPCCGTGAYLVAVLRHIYASLQARDGDALAAQAVQQAMRERVFGFEILPAPFVVAHLQIGMLLNTLHAPLNPGQRAGVYLTNALNGWEPTTEPKTLLMFPELQRERDAADTVKRSRPILVILGNPPYSGFAGVAIEEERSLSQAYRTTQNPKLPRPQGQGLNDLYVRFYRMAERQIAENTQRGIVCFISNYSWLDGLSHPGMRERYLEAFDIVTIDNLNGDKYKTGKTTPDGKPDPSIFSTEFNREGIQVGTAIATLVRKPQHEGAQVVQFRHLWGTGKRAQLQAEAADTSAGEYQEITPSPEIGLPFLPHTFGTNYFMWTRLPELFPTSFPGVNTGRDTALVSIDQLPLIQRMTKYFDPAVSNDEMQRIAPALLKTTGRFNAVQVRDYLTKRGFLQQNIVRHLYRPFDVRWLYWEPETKLLDERREEYFSHVQSENLWFSASQRNRKDDFYQPTISRQIGGYHVNESQTVFFPLYLYDTPKAQLALFSGGLDSIGGRKPNLSDKARDYLAGFDLSPEDGAELLFYHTLAVLHSPVYRVENAGALRQDWPRVPLPESIERLESSAALGRQVAVLLDVETPVPGVTQGNPREDLRTVAVLTTVDSNTPDFTIDVNWGYFGAGSAVMPGRGRAVENDGLTDVYLNGTTYWRGIPTDVWEYTLGGYQVLKKWLSYRETAVLGRPLKPEEAREFMHIARRIASLPALNEALDSNYRLI
ncbi:MAG: type ISP restriction/modification enzyme [Anaerolineae bacterium]